MGVRRPVSGRERLAQNRWPLFLSPNGGMNMSFQNPEIKTFEEIKRPSISTFEEAIKYLRMFAQDFPWVVHMGYKVDDNNPDVMKGRYYIGMNISKETRVYIFDTEAAKTRELKNSRSFKDGWPPEMITKKPDFMAIVREMVRR